MSGWPSDSRRCASRPRSGAAEQRVQCGRALRAMRDRGETLARDRPDGRRQPRKTVRELIREAEAAEPPAGAAADGAETASRAVGGGGAEAQLETRGGARTVGEWMAVRRSRCRRGRSA